jgi:hypothetical protein
MLQQPIKVVNRSMLFNREDQEKLHNSGLGNFPNGVIKAVIEFYHQLDEKISKLIVTIDNSFHHNVYKFNNF